MVRPRTGSALTCVNAVCPHIPMQVRIKCKDYVKKIAVYKDKLAVQLQNKVVIYELANADDFDMHYQSATKIQQKLDCNLLVVTSHHVILCQVRRRDGRMHGRVLGRSG